MPRFQFPQNAWALVLFRVCHPYPQSKPPLLLQQQLNDSSVIISALKTYLVSG